MDNLKEDLINEIVSVMSPRLQQDNLIFLDNILHKTFYNFAITPMETGIVVYDHDNDRMLNIFKANKRLENLRQCTIDQYILYNRKFLEFTGKKYTEVTTEDAKIWLADYGLRVCANTVANTKRYLSSFYTWLHDNGYVDRNIIKPIKNIKMDPPKKEHLNHDEVEMVRDACQTIRELALVDFLLSTGVRVGEITELKIEDVDFIKDKVFFRGEKSRRYRTVYLDSRARKHLIEYLNTRVDKSPYLFPSKKTNKELGYPPALQKSGIEMILHEIASRTTLKKNCTVHLFRRTFATQLHEKGVKLEYIKELLGHASTSTTEHHYVSVSLTDIEYEFRKATAA